MLCIFIIFLFGWITFGAGLSPHWTMPRKKSRLAEEFVLVGRGGHECEMIQEELKMKQIPFIYVNADEDMTCRVLLNSNTENIIQLPILILDGKVICDSIFEIYAFIYKED